jgi:hypothetical protein
MVMGLFLIYIRCHSEEVQKWQGRAPVGGRMLRYSGSMRLRDIQRHMNALETEPERHLAYVQDLPTKDLRRLWRVLPKGQKRLLRSFHRALLVRSVEYLG